MYVLDGVITGWETAKDLKMCIRQKLKKIDKSSNTTCLREVTQTNVLEAQMQQGNERFR